MPLPISKKGQLKTLADFNLRAGDPVRLECSKPRQHFSVQLIGYREKGSVLVAAPKQSGLRLLPNDGSDLTARLISGNWILSFNTRLIRSESEPYGFWHLAWPEQVDAQQLRAITRVPVNLLVTVDVDDLDMPASLGGTVNALCTDIHLAGACLETDCPLAQQGESVFIMARLSVAETEHVILLPATVKNVTERQEQGADLFVYGVEFQTLEEDAQLILAGFVYQQYLVETGYLAP